MHLLFNVVRRARRTVLAPLSFVISIVLKVAAELRYTLSLDCRVFRKILFLIVRHVSGQHIALQMIELSIILATAYELPTSADELVSLSRVYATIQSQVARSIGIFVGKHGMYPPFPRQGKLHGTDVVAAPMTDLLQRLSDLEHALQLQLHLDSVGTADYALASAGAFVIEALTSLTYVENLPKRAIHMKVPAVALMPDVQAGYCWAMAGSQGTLGVALARVMVPRAFTIDHIAKPLSLQYSSAPKGVEVWGILEEGHDWHSVITTGRAAEVFFGIGRNHPFRDISFGLLANFTYDIHALRPTQTFQVLEGVGVGNPNVRGVVFKFRSNWGHDTYTCIYRVRAHGEDTIRERERIVGYPFL